MKKRNSTTVLFIYILFIVLSIYNYTNQILRPTELLIPFLIFVLISKVDKVKTILITGILILFYLISVDTMNNGLTPMTLNRSRIWGYAILFFAMGKIFASINFNKYKSTIYNAMILSLSIIFLIYILIYLDISIVNKYFTPSSIMSEGTLNGMKSTNRILGVSTVMLLLYIILYYINDNRSRLKYILFFINILMFIVTQSRTFFVTFMLVYLILYGSKKTWTILLTSVLLFFPTMQAIVYFLIHNEKYHIYGEKLSELLYVFSSPSMFVRSNDTSYFINDWLSSGYTFVIGRGFNFLLSYPRFPVDFNSVTGEIEILSQYEIWQLRHNSDNLLSIIIVEGGLILLIFVILLFILMFKKIYKNDKRLGFTYLAIVLVYGLTTIHLLTNYVLVFILAYIYYASIKKRNIK